MTGARYNRLKRCGALIYRGERIGRIIKVSSGVWIAEHHYGDLLPWQLDATFKRQSDAATALMAYHHDWENR